MGSRTLDLGSKDRTKFNKKHQIFRFFRLEAKIRLQFQNRQRPKPLRSSVKAFSLNDHIDHSALFNSIQKHPILKSKSRFILKNLKKSLSYSHLFQSI